MWTIKTTEIHIGETNIERTRNKTKSLKKDMIGKNRNE